MVPQVRRVRFSCTSLSLLPIYVCTGGSIRFNSEVAFEFTRSERQRTRERERERAIQESSTATAAATTAAVVAAAAAAAAATAKAATEVDKTAVFEKQRCSFWCRCTKWPT